MANGTLRGRADWTVGPGDLASGHFFPGLEPAVLRPSGMEQEGSVRPELLDHQGPAYNFSDILSAVAVGVLGGGNVSMASSGKGGPPTTTSAAAGDAPGVSLSAIVCLSGFFCIIGVIGIVGNLLVIFIIVCDRKMRRSVTNLFIMNLAVSDLLIMLFGVPEIVLFMLNNGWLLGEALCKTQRYVLVISLYSSVVTLVSVCVERYIAIVHPIKAHIFCSRKRMLAVIGLIWPSVLLLGLPIVLYNQVLPPGGGTNASVVFCMLRFPGPGRGLRYRVAYKYIEFSLFYMIPLVIQVTCYVVIGRHLFAGSDQLHRKKIVVSQDGVQRERMSEAIKQRKGVVKMLIASVIIYFVSYSPHQLLLIYNTFAKAPFHQTWVFLVFVTAMGYLNSAANPVLYCIFSQNFRQKFKSIFVGQSCRTEDKPFRMVMSSESAVSTRYTRVPLRVQETEF